eukprot:CAMPEP_0197022636 /NCGR_PEP_ID=MMETSP1384-20130603/3441_1 /TAXON_ID=29189 /ORGANISM="Ammonia sp." /LENGTH=627 /DNA_ID=CAMNT_0042450709 /DNA_START=29 /DNA_END=1912 /DNA_ORIENTATION=+
MTSVHPTYSTQPLLPHQLNGTEPIEARQIFINDISGDTTTTDLRNLFSSAGKVTNVEIDTNELNRHFAFVTFETSQGVEQAIAKFTTTNLNNTTLVCRRRTELEQMRQKRMIEARCKLFVGNIPQQMQPHELKQEIERLSQRPIADFRHKKGYCFVGYTTPQDAEEAKRNLKNAMCGGKSLNAEFKKEDPIRNEPGFIAVLEQAQRTLYVRDIPSTASAENFKKIFERYGKVRKFTLPTESRSNKLVGYAFIEYFWKKDCDSALAQTEGLLLDGVQIEIRISDPPKDKGKPDDMMHRRGGHGGPMMHGARNRNFRNDGGRDNRGGHGMPRGDRRDHRRNPDDRGRRNNRFSRNNRSRSRSRSRSRDRGGGNSRFSPQQHAYPSTAYPPTNPYALPPNPYAAASRYNGIPQAPPYAAAPPATVYSTPYNPYARPTTPTNTSSAATTATAATGAAPVAHAYPPNPYGYGYNAYGYPPYGAMPQPQQATNEAASNNSTPTANATGTAPNVSATATQQQYAHQYVYAPQTGNTPTASTTAPQTTANGGASSNTANASTTQQAVTQQQQQDASTVQQTANGAYNYYAQQPNLYANYYQQQAVNGAAKTQQPPQTQQAYVYPQQGYPYTANRY